LIKSIRDLFRRKPTASPGLPTAPQSPSSIIAPRPAVTWLSADDPKNPFRVDGYDCLAFVSGMISTTTEQSVARSFGALRSSSGRDHVGNLPPEPTALPCHLQYPFDGKIADGALFKAQQMEEKWDIYLYEGLLYFARSWTGSLVYVARSTTAAAGFVIDRVSVPREQTAQSDEYPVRQVDYLVKSHVLKRHYPHPLPPGLKQDPETVGFFSFGQFGRVCCFATFQDTLRDDILKP